MTAEPTPETGPNDTASEPQDEHELDVLGAPIHVDVDQRIATGICKFCLTPAQLQALVTSVPAAEENPDRDPEPATE